MKLALVTRLWLVLTAAVALSLTITAVYAHERREVGEYQFVVGFMTEPALEGIKNGVSLEVTRGDAPVEGLEDALQVEITHVPSGASKTMSLRTVFGEPGHYTADLIPTAPGHYRFRFFGAIEGMEVDETFNSRSGGGGFDDIQPATELQFPESLPETREIEAAVRGAQGAAQEAQDMALQAEDGASSARVLAIAGIALGVVGIVAGVGSTAIMLRRR